MSHTATLSVLSECVNLKLVSESECAAAEKLINESTPVSGVLERAESLHVHLKVDDTRTLPTDAFVALGGAVEFETKGFVKYGFPDGARLIFSSIPVADDEGGQGECCPRSRPFVDHFGIDLRDESADSRGHFDAVSALAKNEGWDHVPQGGDGSGVHCCHTEVKAKHWLYPPASWDGSEIPVEVAFGELAVNVGVSGCDLRPMNPRKQGAASAKPCCGG